MTITRRTGGHLAVLARFGVPSFAAVAIGCAVAATSGVPNGVWTRSLASWGLGALAAVATALWGGRRMSLALLILAPLGLAATFLSADLQGVHRWIDAGPLHLNAAEVLLPASVVTLAGLRRWSVRLACAAAMLLLLALQPDASQATALGAALLVVAVTSPAARLPRIVAGVLAVVATVVAWLRPDPLAPVPEVEKIMSLAVQVSPFAAGAAWVALLLACGALAWPAHASRPSPASTALAAYALLTALIPLVGAFPVPLVGQAMSPILGLWLGAGLLAAKQREVSAYRPAASGG